MSNKTANLLKALFFFFVAIVCLLLAFVGNAKGSYPYIGALVGTFAGVGFVRRALDK